MAGRGSVNRSQGGGRKAEEPVKMKCAHDVNVLKLSWKLEVRAAEIANECQ